MNTKDIIAVSSRSFSQHPILRAELLRRYQQVRFNETGEKLVGEQLISFLKGATKAIIGLEVIDEALLKQVPTLKVICKKGTGLDKIDQAALARYGVALANAAGLNQRSVAELVIALMISCLRHLKPVMQGIAQDQWLQPTGRQLSGKTVGIIGYGTVGRELAILLQAFQCRCLVYDVEESKIGIDNVKRVDLKTLLKQSDLVSLHIPFNPHTQHFLSADRLNLMKPTAVLINTARGGLVDEVALVDCLRNGKIAAAGFDVLTHEPEINKELLACDHFLLTSHIGGSTEEAIMATGMHCIASLETATFPFVEA